MCKRMKSVLFEIRDADYQTVIFNIVGLRSPKFAKCGCPKPTEAGATRIVSHIFKPRHQMLFVTMNEFKTGIFSKRLPCSIVRAVTADVAFKFMW
jgi:hypothetical protein